MPWPHAQRDRAGRVLLQRANAYFVCMRRARPALGTSPLRGFTAVISRGITPVNSERFHQDLLKVAFGQGCINRTLYGSL